MIKTIPFLAAETAQDFGPYAAQESPDDKSAWQELYSDRLFESEEFGKLALDIKDDVERRFDLLAADELGRSPTDWPLLWSFETDDREEFLGKVRWFSSNHFLRFGRLLTPLVDGIRVRGPFKPLRKELQVAGKLVLLDGQGLGHTAESASSVSTKITRRFGDVDLILLVDSAQQPMQAASLALLRAAASAGYADKIAVAFSHFDQVKGDNLQTFAQKRNHVIASITSAVAGLRQLLGGSVAASLERRMDWLRGTGPIGRPPMPNRAAARGCGGPARSAASTKRAPPPINSAMKPLAREFLTEVIKLVRVGVEKSGGHFEVPKAA